MVLGSIRKSVKHNFTPHKHICSFHHSTIATFHFTHSFQIMLSAVLISSPCMCARVIPVASTPFRCDTSHTRWHNSIPFSLSSLHLQTRPLTSIVIGIPASITFIHWVRKFLIISNQATAPHLSMGLWHPNPSLFPVEFHNTPIPYSIQ